MTLRNSIMLSLAVHLLLFGTGLAFARFAAELFPPKREPVMVTLVGERGNSVTAGQKKSKQRPTETVQKERPRERPAAEQPIRKQAIMPVPAPARNAGESSLQQQMHVMTEPERGSARGDQKAGSASGSVSSEQWAVIVSSIERAKTYPRLARERGIEGTVHVRFRLKPEGDVDRVEVIKSSGFDILDEASVRTVYRAGPMPYVTGWIEVPIAYVLK